MSRIWVGMEGRPHISTNNAMFVLIQNSPSTPYSSGVQICTMNCIESFDKVNRKSGEKKNLSKESLGRTKGGIGKKSLE